MKNKIELQRKLLELNGDDNAYHLTDYGVEETFNMCRNHLMDIPILVCAECGGINIETKVWADPNDDTVLESDYIDEQDNYCRDCEKSVKFKEIKIL